MKKLTTRTAFAFLFACATAAFADSTWQHDPSTPGDYLTAANWQGGIPPTNGYINNGGTAVFAPATGTYFLPTSLYLGSSLGTSGYLTVNSTGSQFLTLSGSLHIGQAGFGAVVQNSGDINSPSSSPQGNLDLGYTASGNGQYFLNGGTARIAYEFMGYTGQGLFQQSGGTNNAMVIGVGPNAHYDLQGGTLIIGDTTSISNIYSTGLDAQGTMSFGNSPITIIGRAQAIFNLSNATFADPSQVSITLGNNSLLILPTGISTAQFASFSTQGLVFNHGQTITIGANQLIEGYSGLDDFVSSAGTIIVTEFRHGLMVTGGSAAGTLYVDDVNSGLSGGNLSSHNFQIIGNNSTGLFHQTAGINTLTRSNSDFSPAITSLIIGNAPLSNGTYQLDGGTLDALRQNIDPLTAINQYVGYSGTGTFIQTGGTNSSGWPPTNGGSKGFSSLYIGTNANSLGSYQLSGTGTLSITTQYVGYSGNGTFAQSGGSNDIEASIYVGYNAGATGIYQYSSGAFYAKLLVLGLNGSGSMIQSGGFPQFDNLIVGSSGTGIYTQTLGQSTVNVLLTLGLNAGSSGTYELSGSLYILLSAPQLLVGSNGVGHFHQNGGTVWLLSSKIYSLSIGSGSDYILDGGALSCASPIVFGNGNFTQNGGTSTGSSSNSVADGLLQLNGGTTNLNNLVITATSTTPAVNLALTANGNLTTHHLTANNKSWVNVTGGTLQADSLNLSGLLTQSGGMITTQGISNAGTATFSNLSSGPITNTGNMTFTGIATVAAISGAGVTTVNGAATLTASSITQNSLTVSGTVHINANGGSSGLSVLKSLTIAVDGSNNPTGNLDLNDNDLIVDYTATGISPFSTIRNQVNYGLTHATGITSTTGSAAPQDKVLAVVDNANHNLTSLSGVTLASLGLSGNQQILGKYTYYGDANLDGKVTGADYTYIDLNLGQGTPAHPNANVDWAMGDFNQDGQITGADYTYIDLNLGKGVGTPLAYDEFQSEMIALHTAEFGAVYTSALEALIATPTATPEPTTLGLLAFGGLALLARRKK